MKAKIQISIEVQDNAITDRGIHAIIDFYHTLAIDETKAPGVQAFVTGNNSPFLNVLFDLRKDRSNSSEIVKLSDSFFSKYNVPWGWFIVPASDANDLLKFGFELIEEAPAMYFDLTAPLPAFNSEAITIEEAGKSDDLMKWVEVINEGYQVQEGDDHFRELNANLLNKGEKKLRQFVLYYKNKIASAGTLFLSNDAVMIHNVATKHNFKKLGLATALTLHMMAIAKKAGFMHCYLDASSEAFNLYQRIGFKVYCKTQIYSLTKI